MHGHMTSRDETWIEIGRTAGFFQLHVLLFPSIIVGSWRQRSGIGEAEQVGSLTC